MLKRIFFIILAILIIFPTVSVSAYEVTGFEITAEAGLLVSLDTGEVLFNKNENKKVYPAAITNIMTALVILESDKYSPDAKITMTEKARKDILGTGVTDSHTKVGEEFSHTDLLHMIIMCSFGDASCLAADYFYGSHDAFVVKMNETAKKLGMNNTNFTNPMGVHDPKHYTTASDVYKMTEYALKNKTFKEICAKARYDLAATNMQEKRILSTTNFLLKGSNSGYEYTYATGVKTGYTDEAGRCIVSTAKYNDLEYICILMKAPNNPLKRQELTESANLFRWAFNNFASKEIATSTEPVCEIPLELSMETDFVPLYFKNGFYSILPKDVDESTIVIKTELFSESVKAPVKKDQVLGKAQVIFAEKVIGEVDLVVGEDVKANPVLKFADTLKMIFTSTVMIVVYVVLGLALVAFIAKCITMNYSKGKKRKVRYIPYDGKERENRHKR